MSIPRRYRIFSRADSNAAAAKYAQLWTGRVEKSLIPDSMRETLKQRHADPMVTVAVRADGSVQSVTLVTSSGVPAVDEWVRRVARDLQPYPVFPPDLAFDYDVVEIRLNLENRHGDLAH